jgi:hypothetical protein
LPLDDYIMRYNKALTGMLRASQGRLTNRLRKNSSHSSFSI